MDEQKNFPVQDASAHAPIEKGAAQVITNSGGEVHHEMQESEKHIQEVQGHVNQQSASIDHDQFEEKKEAGTLPKKGMIEKIEDFLTFKWFKTNMRNKYEQDVSKIQQARQDEKSQHLTKIKPPYSPVPQGAGKMPAEPATAQDLHNGESGMSAGEAKTQTNAPQSSQTSNDNSLDTQKQNLPN